MQTKSLWRAVRFIEKFNLCLRYNKGQHESHSNLKKYEKKKRIHKTAKPKLKAFLDI